jgi:hypothetical protein
MYFDVKGFSRKQKRVVTDAALFFIDKLIHPNTLKVLELTIVRKKIWADGFCQFEDSNIRPRSFILEISNQLEGEELIKTIAHELVHVKQYVKGELKERYKPNHYHMWHKELIIVNDDNFYDVPWEVEARQLEEIFIITLWNTTNGSL